VNKILKYELANLDTGDLREIEMPQGTRILAVQVQERGEIFKGKMTGPSGDAVPLTAYGPRDETVCLWAMSNTDESRKVRRMFRIYGTGRPIEEDPFSLNHIGTVQTGPFVWHIFEKVPPPLKCQRCGTMDVQEHGPEGHEVPLCFDCLIDWQHYADAEAVLHGKPQSWGKVFEEFLAEGGGSNER